MFLFERSGPSNAQRYQHWREAGEPESHSLRNHTISSRGLSPDRFTSQNYGGVDRSRSCTSLFRGQRFSKPPELPILALPRKSGADEGHRTPMLLNFARLFENRVYTNSTTSAKLWCPKGDLNPQTFRRTLLRRLCFRFHHSGTSKLGQSGGISTHD